MNRRRGSSGGGEWGRWGDMSGRGTGRRWWISEQGVSAEVGERGSSGERGSREVG